MSDFVYDRTGADRRPKKGISQMLGLDAQDAPLVTNRILRASHRRPKSNSYGDACRRFHRALLRQTRTGCHTARSVRTPLAGRFVDALSPTTAGATQQKTQFKAVVPNPLRNQKAERCIRYSNRPSCCLALCSIALDVASESDNHVRQSDHELHITSNHIASCLWLVRSDATACRARRSRRR
jgi:hypothetical protein